EDAQVLDHSQISGKRGVDGLKIGALEGARAMFGEVNAINVNRAGGRLEDAENHIDGGRLAGSVGAKKSDNLTQSDREGDVVDSNGVTVELANTLDSENVRHDIMIAGCG